MALFKDMKTNDIIKFIDQELLPQTVQEIKSLIEPEKKQGGYFVVTRQIFCMVDFLGATYAGYPRRERLQDSEGRKIARSRKAIKFMKAFFKPRTIYTPTKITMIHDMYRNGLVHLYQPKALKYKTGRLDWFIYKGQSQLSVLTVPGNKGTQSFYNVDHLKIISNDPAKKRYYLAININTLYDDFEGAVNSYKSKVKSKPYLQSNWRTTINAIYAPR